MGSDEFARETSWLAQVEKEQRERLIKETIHIHFPKRADCYGLLIKGEPDIQWSYAPIGYMLWRFPNMVIAVWRVYLNK